MNARLLAQEMRQDATEVLPRLADRHAQPGPACNRMNDLALQVRIGDRCAACSGFGTDLACQGRLRSNPAAQSIEDGVLRTERGVVADDDAGGCRTQLDAGDTRDPHKELDQKPAHLGLYREIGNLQADPTGGQMRNLARGIHTEATLPER